MCSKACEPMQQVNLSVFSVRPPQVFRHSAGKLIDITP